jgi:2-polyprenyl-3-methyl-5-hydroxy-6-metoxy-1,4-benzoquinol methylase
MTADDGDAAARSVDLIYRAAAAGARCWARNHRGYRQELPMIRWIGGPHTTLDDPLADEHVLGHCSGRPTLDVGCGPGRFTASLQQRGSAALGIDTIGRGGGFDPPARRNSDPVRPVRAHAR